MYFIGIDHYFSFSLPTKFSRLTSQVHHGSMRVNQHQKSRLKSSGVVIFTDEISNEVQRTLNYVVILALICAEYLLKLHCRYGNPITPYMHSIVLFVMIFMHWLHSHANIRSTTYHTAEKKKKKYTLLKPWCTPIIVTNNKALIS